jgi:MoaA/NifB/PqqE/SkfB family radical SAM enzyme
MITSKNLRSASLIDREAKNIQWLEFELSNNCQYADRHYWCPASRDDRPLIFLRSHIVYTVVDFFKQYDFAGRIYLSGYSEPLIDPRLADLVRYIKKHLPKCNIDMFSNGIACDENLLADIREAGVDMIRLSAYSASERARFQRYAAAVPGVVLVDRQVGSADDDIDGRINVYDPGTKGIGGPCYMPTLYYFVRNNGDVNMCFWDWKYTQVFGNLYCDSVEDTLLNEDRLKINRELRSGNRDVLPVCSSCQLPDYRCTREYIGRMK